MSKKIIISNFTRNKKFVVIAILITSSVTAFAQAPEILWTKIIGGAQEQSAGSIIETSDKGFIIAGSNGTNLYILKTNSDGDTIWTKPYNFNTPFLSYTVSGMEQTSDSCFIITGYSHTHYITDVFLTKINPSGDTLWFKPYLGYAFDPDVKQTFDGGYIISAIINQAGEGLQYPGGLLVKTDSAGNMSWNKDYYVESATSVVPVEDGGFVFTGGYYNVPYMDAFLIKTNSFGDSVWCKIYDLPDSNDVWYNRNKVIKTSDGGFLILIANHIYGNSLGELILIKADKYGDTMWRNKYGGTEFNGGFSVQQTIDNGFIITGFTTSFWGDKDVWILKIDSLGNTLWSHTFGGNDDEVGWCVRQTSDDGYIICGDILYPNRDSDILLIRLAPDPFVKVKNLNERANDYNLSQNYPNPFNPVTTIKYQIPKHGLVTLTVYDVLGKELTTLVNEKQNAGSYIVNWEATNYPSGVYFYRLTAGDYVETRKMVLLK